MEAHRNNLEFAVPLWQSPVDLLTAATNPLVLVLISVKCLCFQERILVLLSKQF